jgi:signal transduction histidine kinase/CheY-like chemotaxis protein
MTYVEEGSGLAKRFMRWLSPPVFPGDEEKTYHAHIAQTVIYSLILFNLLGFLAVPFASFNAGPMMVIMVTMALLSFLNLYLIRHSYRRGIDLLVLVEAFSFLTVLVASRGTIRAPITAVYLNFILIAGALFEKRGVVLSTLACSLAVALLGVAEYRGLLGTPDLTLTATQWVTLTVLFGMTGSLSLLISQMTRQALAHSRMEVQERARAEAQVLRLLGELHQRSAELEQRTSELQQRTNELSAANLELEKASRMKDEFLASMSHELRTPLTGILGLSESLQLQTYGSLNERQLKSVHTIETSGRHLLELINDILDLSKIEAGELMLQIVTCQVTDLCLASLQLTKGMAKKKDIQVEYTNDLAFASLRADPRRVKQMLVNLLGNAIKFTPQGGQVGLVVSEAAEGNAILFIVWDTGIGIRQQDMDLLFKPFVQIDSSLSRQHSGTGLGLSLVSRLARLHGGSVSVESTPGQGSRFTLSLPWDEPARAQEAQPALPASEVQAPAVPGADGQAPLATILFADDDPVIMETVVDVLQGQGYRVISAHSGQELLDLARADAVDIILTDIQMPGMDGLQAIRLLRGAGLAHLERVPIIAVTALAMTGDKERFLEAGATHYLSKPLRLGELLALLQKLVPPAAV